MRKVPMYLAAGAVAAAAVFAAAQPASADLLVPHGSFTFEPVPGAGPVTVNTGHISATTSSLTEPATEVEAVPALLDDGSANNLVGVIAPGDLVTFGPSSTLPVPAGTGSQSVAITLSVGSLVFTFDTETTVTRLPVDLTKVHSSGSLTLELDGTLSFGDGVFEPGAPTTLTAICGQSETSHVAGVISCNNSLITIGTAGPPGTVGAPEPASLTLLGASLLGFGLLWRRRTL